MMNIDQKFGRHNPELPDELEEALQKYNQEVPIKITDNDDGSLFYVKRLIGNEYAVMQSVSNKEIQVGSIVIEEDNDSNFKVYSTRDINGNEVVRRSSGNYVVYKKGMGFVEFNKKPRVPKTQSETELPPILPPEPPEDDDIESPPTLPRKE